MQTTSLQLQVKGDRFVTLEASSANFNPQVAFTLASGFMGPAELLHLGIPFVAIPTPGHGEQAFNASALEEISDVTVVRSIDNQESITRIRHALGTAKCVVSRLQRYGRMGPLEPYPDIRHEAICRIFPASGQSTIRTPPIVQRQRDFPNRTAI